MRLAAQLSGWKLDIISEAKFKQMEEEAVAQLQQIDGVTEAIARSDVPPRASATLEELAEASEQELAAMPGLGGAEAATRIQHERRDDDGAPAPGAHPARRRRGPSRSPSASGCSSSAASASAPSQLLEDAGYKTVEDILREDEDKLAIKTGLGIKKARAIKQGAEHFLSSERRSSRPRAGRPWPGRERLRSRRPPAEEKKRRSIEENTKRGP